MATTNLATVPDDILHTILDRVDPVTAARTQVLTKSLSQRIHIPPQDAIATCLQKVFTTIARQITPNARGGHATITLESPNIYLTASWRRAVLQSLVISRNLKSSKPVFHYYTSYARPAPDQDELTFLKASETLSILSSHETSPPNFTLTITAPVYTRNHFDTLRSISLPNAMTLIIEDDI